MTESLDAIMAGRDANASADTETTTTTERTGSTEQGRDERGRFAGRQEQQQPDSSTTQAGTQQSDAAQTPQETKPNSQVPQQALHAERQARRQADERYRNLERQFTELQQTVQRMQPQGQQQRPADPLAELIGDPGGYFQQQISPFQTAVSQIREELQELHAVQAHGADKVTAAKRAVEELRDTGDPRLSVLWGRIQQAANPYDELVRWHAEQARLTQFGDDPEAYINAEVERRLAERGQQQQPAAAGQIPPSFAGARNGSAARQADHYGGPRPLSDIMGR